MTVTPLPRGPEDDEQPERPPRRSAPPAPGRAPSLLDSFNYAFEGIIHVLRTQRNLRIHFLAAVLVFGGAIAVGVTRLQLIALALLVLGAARERRDAHAEYTFSRASMSGPWS